MILMNGKAILSYNHCAISTGDITDIFHDAKRSSNKTNHKYFALVIIIIHNNQ